MTAQCPTCGQPWPDRSGRVCGICHQPIRKHDRFHFVGSVVQHRSCEDPKLSKAAPPLQESFPREEQP